MRSRYGLNAEYPGLQKNVQILLIPNEQKINQRGV